MTVSPILILPLSGSSWPVSNLKRVVLPAPLGPIIPTIPAGGKLNVKFSNNYLFF